MVKKPLIINIEFFFSLQTAFISRNSRTKLIFSCQPFHLNRYSFCGQKAFYVQYILYESRHEHCLSAEVLIFVSHSVFCARYKFSLVCLFSGHIKWRIKEVYCYLTLVRFIENVLNFLCRNFTSNKIINFTNLHSGLWQVDF